MSDLEEAPQPPPPPPPPPRSGWGAGRIIGLICATIVALIGLGLMLGGLGVIALQSLGRDDDGYFTTDTERFAARGYAITTERINLDPDIADDVSDELIGTLRVQAESANGSPIFVGVGRTGDVVRYLAGVPHAQFVDFRRGRAVLEPVPGQRPLRTPPGDVDFWVAQSQGPGERSIDWDPSAGVWTVAVLNADASRGVAVNADIGAKLGWLIWVGAGLLIVGLVFTGTAVYAIVALSRRSERDASD